MGELDATRKTLLLKVLDEYEKVLLFTAERPESQLSLALFYMGRGDANKAEDAYKEALRLQPLFVPAYVNYSDFLLSSGRKSEALTLLNEGIKKLPNMGVLQHALGLWYVRNKEKDKAIAYLKKAVTLDPNNSRFSYVYAVAIGEKNPKKAVEVLEKVYSKHTGDMQIVSGLVYYYKQMGENEKSTMYEKKLKALQNFSVR